MRIKLNFFIKLFSFMMIGFLLVVTLQYLSRVFFFEEEYINSVNDRFIDIIVDVKSEVDSGEELYDILYDYEITDINAYILDDSLDNIFGYYSFDLIFEDDPLDESEMFDYKNGVYYATIEDEFGYDGSTFHIYAIELENGDYLVFELFLTGLIDANTTMSRIDLYVILVIFFIFVPLTYWFSKRISVPLRKMQHQVKELSDLNFLPPLEIKTNDEIEDLAHSINIVSVKLNDAIKKLQDDISFEQRRDKKRRELIASLSHELKTPLTAMRAVVEGMVDKVGKYQDREKYLIETLSYLNFMENLSKDLIDVIKIESKEFNKTSYSLKNIMSKSEMFTKDNLDKNNQALHIDIDDCNVLCNKDMIIRVLINLISNGIKYSEENSIISIKNEIVDNEVIISIENSNAFIDESEIKNIFEPFYRIEKSRNKATGGSGLGLFIIKTILDSHNSNYSIKNTKSGVLFTFTLKLDT